MFTIKKQRQRDARPHAGEGAVLVPSAVCCIIRKAENASAFCLAAQAWNPSVFLFYRQVR